MAQNCWRLNANHCCHLIYSFLFKYKFLKIIWMEFVFRGHYFQLNFDIISACSMCFAIIFFFSLYNFVNIHIPDQSNCLHFLRDTAVNCQWHRFSLNSLILSTLLLKLYAIKFQIFGQTVRTFMYMTFNRKTSITEVIRRRRRSGIRCVSFVLGNHTANCHFRKMNVKFEVAVVNKGF